MKVLVLGSGNVSVQICSYISRDPGCDITLLGNDAALDGIASRIPHVRGLRGDIASPVDLAQAEIADTDLLVATTDDERGNILASYFANRINKDVRVICRVRRDDEHELLRRANGGFVDVLVNPERELAAAAQRLLSSRSMFLRRPILNERAQIVGLRIGEASNILNTQLRQLTPLFENLTAVIVGFRRNGQLRIARSDDELFAGDQIYFMAARFDIPRALDIFGIRSARRDNTIIFGAGDVGLRIALGLEEESRNSRVKLIESRRELAEVAAEVLGRTIVFHGDSLDEELLSEAGIEFADAILAVSDRDRDNVLALAKARTLNSKALTIGLVESPSMAEMADPLGIDVSLNLLRTTVSAILPHVRQLFVDRVLIIGDDEAELIELRVSAASSLRGKKIKDARFPDGILIGALLRNNFIKKIHPDVRLRRGDRLALFVLSDGIAEATRFLHSNAFAR